MSNIMKGTVKFFNFERGFGFIKPADNSKDIFVHMKSIKSGTLTDGCNVSYETIVDKNGKQAAWNVEVLD